MTQSHRIYFVDTSYLLELYAVPGFNDPQAKDVIRAKFKDAWTRSDRLLVPLGCLLEFGNHIAALKSPGERDKWAGQLHELVDEALEPGRKLRRFVIVEAPPLDDLCRLVKDWCTSHVTAPRGLVDAATAERAKAFKRDRAMGNPVHIWTRDRKLKGVEPDAEPNPFV